MSEAPATGSPAPSAPGPRAPRWAWVVATGFGSGLLRPAPGTWGSAAAVLLWILLAHVAPFAPRRAAEAWFLLLPIGMIWLSVKASDLVSKARGDKDPGYIVADEFAGQWIALWPLRWELLAALHAAHDHGAWKAALVLFAVPFLVFRAFDIWKPWPAKQVQGLPGGEGIVADDVVAGLYAMPVVALLAPWLARFVG